MKNSKKENCYTLIILLINVFFVLAVLFTIFLTKVSHYTWVFPNGSYVKYNILPSRVIAKGNCISTSTWDFENCNEMIENINTRVNILVNIFSAFFPSSSIEGLMRSINNSIVILMCLLAAYEMFLIFSTLILLVKDYTNYNKRSVHIFSIVLAGISFSCIFSSLLYWAIMHITWRNLFSTPERSYLNNIQVINYSLGIGYHILIGISIFTLMEIIILLKSLPKEEKEYSLIF